MWSFTELLVLAMERLYSCEFKENDNKWSAKWIIKWNVHGQLDFGQINFRKLLSIKRMQDLLWDKKK